MAGGPNRGTRGARARTRTYIGLAISAVLVAGFLWRVWPRTILRDVERVSIAWLLAAIAVKQAVIVVKAVRWGVVIRAAKGGWPRRIGAATFVGCFGNAALPARLGELARVEICKRHNPRLDRPELYATVVLERLLDLSVVLAVLGLVMLVVPLPGGAAGLRMPAAVLAGLGVVVAIGLWLGRRAVGERLIPGWFGGRLRTTLARIAERAAAGLALVRSTRQTALALALTAAAWALEIGGTYLALRAFGIDVPVRAAVLVTTVVSLGVAIPSAPSGLGTAQALYVVCLAPFGVAADLAVSVSVLMTAAMLLVLAAIGLGCIWREGLSFSGLAAARAEPEAAGAAGPPVTG